MIRTVKKQLGLAGKNPKLAWHKAKVTLMDERIARRNFRQGHGYAKMPHVVAVRLTNLCNCKCKMCGQPRLGDEGIPKGFFRDHLTVDDWKHVIDQIAPSRPNFYLWGGEPMIYKGLYKVIRYAKQSGLTVQMNTNALLIPEHIDDIVESGLDDLIISLDGPEDVHDEIRGVPGLFQKITSGIRGIRDKQRELNVKHPLIRIRGTINPANFDHLFELVKITQELDGDSLSFNHFWFTSVKEGKRYEKIMKEVFDTEANSWQGFVFEPKDLKLDALGAELEKFKCNTVDFPITISPNLSAKDLQPYYNNLNETFGAKDCYTIYFKTYLMPNGDVTPCPDFPDYIAGNLLQDSFADIWNGEKYRHFRRSLKTNGLLPICSRCCDLHVGNVAFY